MIKKVAISVLAAFYLLLSTGMYVCAMHCAAADVLKPKVADCCAHMGKMPMAKQDTRHAANDCFKKHANFVVKENLKPSFSFKVVQQVTLISTGFIEKRSSAFPDVSICRLNNHSKAPPPVSGRTYLLQLRTLLI